MLTQEENLAGLAALNRELVARAEAIDSPRRVVLDMESTEIPVYGEREQSAYNGHFESTRLFADMLRKIAALPAPRSSAKRSRFR